MSIRQYVSTSHLATLPPSPGHRAAETPGTLPPRHTGGVVQSRPATDQDRVHLAAHIGRKAIQATHDRSFSRGWRPTTEGAKKAKLYRIGTPQLGRCQYAILRHKQRAAVFAVDVDRKGTPGGMIENIDAAARQTLAALAAAGAGPAWIGVNPINGKCHLLWLVDPVYADEDGDSAPMRLYEATWKKFRDVLGGDKAFSNWWMRSPFYTGADETAYVWHCQHHRVDSLTELMREARTMSAVSGEDERQEPTYRSGRERLEAAIARRKEAEAFNAVVEDVTEDLPDVAGEKIDGVRVRWADETHSRADRDETAFRHALAEAHRLRATGKRMSDAAIIDAYETAYAVAQAIGADGRAEDMPPMRDRLTMARRVRGYVISGKRSESTAVDAPGRADSRERKILATLGRRGGKKAAQRWQTDPDGDYARTQREKLAKTAARKRVKGASNRQRIALFINEQWMETDTVPTWNEIMAETSLSRATVARHVAALREAGEIPDS